MACALEVNNSQNNSQLPLTMSKKVSAAANPAVWPAAQQRRVFGDITNRAFGPHSSMKSHESHHKHSEVVPALNLTKITTSGH